MFCGNCGTPASEDQNFCTKCGSPISRPTISAPKLRAESLENEQDIRSSLPDIEAPLTFIRKTSIGTFFAGDRPKEYSWLNQTVDLVLAPNAIVVVASTPVTKFHETADFVAAVGATSIVGGLLISMPVALIGEAHEKLFGQHNKFDKPSLQTLVDSGNAIWISKSDACFYFIDVKGGFFGDSGCLYSITGKFQTATGDLLMCLGISDALFPIASGIRKVFEKPGYNFEKSVAKKNDDLWIKMKEIFMGSI